MKTGSFSKLKIRVKLLLAFGSLLLLSSILVIIFFQIMNRVSLYQQSSEEIDAINIHLLEMDAAAKYFMFEGYKNQDFQKDGRSNELDFFFEHHGFVSSELDSLKKLKILDDVLAIDTVQRVLAGLNKHVKELTLLFKERGFKDFGLEGSLREAIHDVESSTYPYSKVDMLMLRRHEKDFFLRKDLKYLQEFLDRILVFEQSVEQNPQEENKNVILEDIRSYHANFESLVEAENKIGLKETSGIKGIINNDLLELKASIRSLRSLIKERSATFRQRSAVVLLVVLIVQLAVGTLLAVTYADIITRAVKELQGSMKNLADGIFPPALAVKSEDEIGKTKSAFNQLLDRMKAATRFSESLGEGNLKAQYDERFTDDILAQSLVNMQHQLVEANQKQAITNWVNYGSAQLNDILKLESEQVDIISDKLVNLLVNYLPANQGALYIIHREQDEEYLERIATYAYDKKKFITQRIAIGEGLVGQCVLEKNPIMLTEVPKDYIKITSGLGEATPRFIVIVPLVIHGQVMGVIEFASFEQLEPYKIEFLQKISENIASILLGKKNREETSRLLAEAKVKEQRLIEQEEELRQNAEEMQASQELMQRQLREFERSRVVTSQ